MDCLPQKTCTVLDKGFLLVYNTNRLLGGNLFAGNEEPDKATGWNACHLSGSFYLFQTEEKYGFIKETN